MRIATLILPTSNNAGQDTTDVHTALQSVLVDTFGGFTASTVNGGWRDDATGRVHLDASLRYEIAMDTSDANVASLESIARWFGHLAGQLSVLVVHASGEVSFVDPAIAMVPA